MSNNYDGEFVDAPKLDREEWRARKQRNLWLGLALGGFVLLVGVITIIRLSSADLSNSGFYYDADGKSPSATSGGEVALPPGMTREQAAPPENLEPTPAEAPE